MSYLNVNVHWLQVFQCSNFLIAIPDTEAEKELKIRIQWQQECTFPSTMDWWRLAEHYAPLLEKEEVVQVLVRVESKKMAHKGRSPMLWPPCLGNEMFLPRVPVEQSAPVLRVQWALHTWKLVVLLPLLQGLSFLIWSDSKTPSFTSDRSLIALVL